MSAARRTLIAAVAAAFYAVAAPPALPANASPGGPAPSGIAYVRWNYVVTAPAIYVLGPDGRSRMVADSPGGALDPAWSPDGQRIAYVHRVSDTESKLVIMDPSGNVHPVYFDFADIAIVRRPSWSPDGQRLVFAGSARFSRQLRIYVIALGNPRRVLSVGNGDAPRWSPDGNKLAYIRGGGTRYGFPIFAHTNDIPVGTVTIANWTHGRGGPRITSEVRVEPAGATSLDWAPDSNSIVFSSGRQLYQSDLAGVVEPLPTSVPASHPAFLGDGSAVVFSEGECFTCGPLFVHPGDSQITALSGFYPSVHGSFAAEGEVGIPVEDPSPPPHESHQYVAIGDSVTTGHSVESCKGPDRKWVDGCQPDDGDGNLFPPGGTPYPEILAGSLGMSDLSRVGIWGYKVREAASNYPVPGKIPLQETLDSALEDRDGMFSAADGAQSLVTGALGANDAEFSNIGLLAKRLNLYSSPDGYQAVFDDTLAMLERSNKHDFLTMARVFEAASDRGVNVVIPLYYVPYEGAEEACRSMNDIARAIVDAVDFEIQVNLRDFGDPNADPRIRLVSLGDLFAGHGATGDLEPDPDSWVYAKTCSLKEVAELVPISILQKMRNKDRPSDVEKAIDPHPNQAGQEAMADSIASVVVAMPPPGGGNGNGNGGGTPA